MGGVAKGYALGRRRLRGETVAADLTRPLVPNARRKFRPDESHTLIDVGIVAGNRHHCFAVYHLYTGLYSKEQAEETAKIAIVFALGLDRLRGHALGIVVPSGDRSLKRVVHPIF